MGEIKLELTLKDPVEYNWVRGEGRPEGGSGRNGEEQSGGGRRGQCSVWAPSQKHREELKAESPPDRRLGRKAHLPSPKFLTRNILAGP